MYGDDTPVERMRKERFDGIESKSRTNTTEKNLEIWEQMLTGTEYGKTCVIRAKIDMQHKNKCMRDPVMYRVQLDAPHPRFGTKYKVRWDSLLSTFLMVD